MTTHEQRARQILAQAEADNAEHPIGVGNHRVQLIAKALEESEARRDRLAAALRESHGCVPCDGMEEMGECFVCEALAEVEKETP